MSAELKPCPFCGRDDPWMYQQTKDEWSVQCQFCTAEVIGNGVECAIIAWNRRAAPPQPAEPVAQLTDEQIDDAMKLCPAVVGLRAGPDILSAEQFREHLRIVARAILQAAKGGK